MLTQFIHSIACRPACLFLPSSHGLFISSFISYLLQINILLNFSAGEDCPCPEEIQEELNSFHEELRLHCGKVQCIVLFGLMVLFKALALQGESS